MIKHILVLLTAWLVVGCNSEPPNGSSVKTELPLPSDPTSSADHEALFIDAAASSGLDFVHWNGMTGEFYFSEMMGSGVALFDYDNDGDLDVYLVQGAPVDDGKEPLTAIPESTPKDRLYRNDLTIDADGTATVRLVDVTEESGLRALGYGMGVAAADFDRDGFVDLYLTQFGSNQLWRNQGDGTFQDVTVSSGADDRSWSVPAAVLDYDRDGWLDLYIGNYVDYQISANKRCTDELGARNYCGPHAFAPQPDTLLRNLGDGTFEDVSKRSGIREIFGGALGVVSGDFNEDGWLDLYVGNDGMPNQLWINQGDGTFEDEALLAGAAVNGNGQAEASMGISAADYDQDGDEDLFITHLGQETNTVYANEGQAIFEDLSAESGLGAPSFEMTGFGTGWFDYDNDGWLDLLAVNGAVKTIKRLALAGDPFPLHQKNQLFHNQGGTFEEISDSAGAVFQLSEVSRGAAFGDLDNDGDIDVLINNNNGPARLLLNQKGQDRPWVGLRLLGRDGSDAIGAWVELERLDASRLHRRVVTTASYGSSSDPRLLFGLSDAEGVGAIKVHWPDGSIERWEEPPAANRYISLRQGEGRRVEDNS